MRDVLVLQLFSNRVKTDCHRSHWLELESRKGVGLSAVLSQENEKLGFKEKHRPLERDGHFRHRTLLPSTGHVPKLPAWAPGEHSIPDA